ncbi:uncharacterized protein LOC132588952 [Heteronotia binoei]|uniref:uncharacterized protein LOC132588952 n=1 Tax=Heteronotia binoei TaxID=13085 RepID=UPI00292EB13D|nr:uncharacterized protein LOC132588952 [Heteronotia binoei]
MQEAQQQWAAAAHTLTSGTSLQLRSSLLVLADKFPKPNLPIGRLLRPARGKGGFAGSTRPLAAAAAEAQNPPAFLPAGGPLPGASPAEPLINTGGLAEAAAAGETRASPEKPAPPSGLPSAFVTVCWLRCPAPFEAAIMRNFPQGNLQALFPVTALTIIFSAAALGLMLTMVGTMLVPQDAFPLQLESRVLAILDRWNNSQPAAMGKWNISQQEYPVLSPAA